MDEIHISMDEIPFLVKKITMFCCFKSPFGKDGDAAHISSFSSITLLSTSCRAKPLTSATPPVVVATERQGEDRGTHRFLGWASYPNGWLKLECVTLWVPAFYDVFY